MSAAISPAIEPAVISSPVRPRPKFRLIPRFETHPTIVAFAQTAVGKLSLLFLFGVILRQLDDEWLLKACLLGVMAFVPKARRLLVLVATLCFTNFFWYENSVLAQLAKVTHWKQLFYLWSPFLLLSAALIFFVRKHPKSLVARRPVPCLLVFYAMLLAGAHFAPLDNSSRFIVWAFLLVFSGYFWYLSYAISDSATPAGDGVVRQFGTFRPFWGSTNVPYPKGASYWRRIEAKTPEELAVTMIKGVKLALWGLLLSLGMHSFSLVHQKLGIPALLPCIVAFSQGKPYPLLTSWLSIPMDILDGLFLLSVWGHMVIATCRMAGFRALRNTYAPLSSQTIAEFWNRYHYYFKELLVDMFFYPTFVRCFKQRPALRICFATFMAAAVGNTLFHFMRDIHVVSLMGMSRTILNFPYVVYSCILALGIAASQIRSRHAPLRRGWFRSHVGAPACVFGFYCFLHIFETASFPVGMRYLAFLFLGR